MNKKTKTLHYIFVGIISFSLLWTFYRTVILGDVTIVDEEFSEDVISVE